MGNLNRFQNLENCQENCLNKGKTKHDVTAGIVIGIIVFGVLVIVGLLAFKYYNIFVNNENYRIFQNSTSEERSNSVSNLQSYENPTFQMEPNTNHM